MNQKLIENNYLIIPNFIDSERAEKLAREFKSYCEENNLKGDDQAPLSNSEYNYISFLELLCEKTPEVSKHIGETVLPTYCYSRVYKKDSVLEKHTDRNACEVSLTLHLDGDYPWPIWIKTPEGKTKFVSLNPGDAMLYLGIIAEHGRNKFEGEWYAQLFLHYVMSRGENSKYYFDKNGIEAIKFEKKELNEEKKVEDAKEEKIEEIKEEKAEETTDATISAEEKKFVIGIKSDNNLSKFIRMYDDMVSPDLCKKIIDEYESSGEWMNTYVGNEGLTDTAQRNCVEISISNEQIISRNYEVRKFIDESLCESIRKAMEQYISEFKTLTVFKDTGYQLLKYEVGGHYILHTDSFTREPRSVTCSICLNDDYVGGEFAFFEKEIQIRQKVGSILVFPSNFMYPHEIMKVREGTRYSVVTWLL